MIRLKQSKKKIYGIKVYDVMFLCFELLSSLFGFKIVSSLCFFLWVRCMIKYTHSLSKYK